MNDLIFKFPSLKESILRLKSDLYDHGFKIPVEDKNEVAFYLGHVAVLVDRYLIDETLFTFQGFGALCHEIKEYSERIMGLMTTGQFVTYILVIRGMFYLFDYEHNLEQMDFIESNFKPIYNLIRIKDA